MSGIVLLKKRIKTRNLLPPLTLLGGYTETDPGAIKVSSGQGSAISACPGLSFINARLGNVGVVSDLPSNGLRWTRSSQGLKGLARVSNTADMLQILCVLGATAVPEAADLIKGVFLTNGTVGFGCGVFASAGAWQAFSLSQAAGVWTRTAAVGAPATGVGARVVMTANTAATTSRLGRAYPVDATGATIVSPANSGVVLGPVTLADGLSTFGIYTGWGTGAGTLNTDVTVGGFEALADLVDLFAAA